MHLNSSTSSSKYVLLFLDFSNIISLKYLFLYSPKDSKSTIKELTYSNCKIELNSLIWKILSFIILSRIFLNLFFLFKSYESPSL